MMTRSRLSLLLLGCLLLFTSSTHLLPASERGDSHISTGAIPRAWLVKVVATHDKITLPMPKRPGWSEDAIKDLQRLAKPGDEIWLFDNGGLAAKKGRIGFALVRKSECLYHVMTLIS